MQPINIENNQNAGFIKIQNGAFMAFVLPENLHKVESKLAKVKPPVMDYGKRTRYDYADFYPAYKAGMSTAEYVRAFENNNLKMVAGVYSELNENPAAEYDPAIPLLVQDENPDFDPATDTPAPKAKPARKTFAELAERVAELGKAIESGDGQSIADIWLFHVKPYISK